MLDYIDILSQPIFYCPVGRRECKFFLRGVCLNGGVDTEAMINCGKPKKDSKKNNA